MENIFKILFVSLFCTLLFSCEKDGDLAVADLKNGTTLSSDVSSLVLTKANSNLPAVKFSTTSPDYGAQVVTSNSLQFAPKGTSFSNPKEIAISGSSLTLSVQELNAILLNMGLNPGTSYQIEVREKSVLASSVAPVYSPTITLTLTPYALTSYIYTPGAYQGWDPGTSNALVSANSNGIYIGYINFPSAGSEFKITADKTWTTNYGDDGANGTLEVGGANIAAPGAGFYKLTVNMNTKTYTMVPYSMGIVGSATPNAWAGPDLQMSWDNATTSWIYTGTFAAGEIKFRTNNVWTESYGGANGVITNDNITVTAGTHTVRFNPFTMTYSVQ